MQIIKLGGSLYNTSQLKVWLTKLTELTTHETIIIVPGGGPFADQVREAQQLHQFSESHAHQMALLAMAQFGTLIAGIEPQCKIISSWPEKTVAPLSVWLPDIHVMQADGLPHSWDVTSDSLALWLAQQLHAEQLTLVKRKLLRSHLVTDWQQAHIIDAAFNRLYQHHPIKCVVAHCDNAVSFAYDGILIQ